MRQYEVVTETGMPHLEESLRYATTRERHCLTEQELYVSFPVLTSPSLAGCQLQDRARDSKSASFELICETGHGTTGHAEWRKDEQVLHGRLEVKLGGKNMTFFQRVTATPLGECQRVENVSSAARYPREGSRECGVGRGPSKIW